MTGDASRPRLFSRGQTPLTAMVHECDAGFSFLIARRPISIRAKEAFQAHRRRCHRAGAVVESIRAELQ